MRRRGIIFSDFKEVEKNTDPVVMALGALNSNIKLVMELLADLRVNTSDDPKADERK